jgi:hypothetical protein
MGTRAPRDKDFLDAEGAIGDLTAAARSLDDKHLLRLADKATERVALLRKHWREHQHRVADRLAVWDDDPEERDG